MATCWLHLDVDVKVFFSGWEFLRWQDGRIEELFVCGCYYIYIYIEM